MNYITKKKGSSMTSLQKNKYILEFFLSVPQK